jgi:hypothetical protein
MSVAIVPSLSWQMVGCRLKLGKKGRFCTTSASRRRQSPALPSAHLQKRSFISSNPLFAAGDGMPRQARDKHTSNWKTRERLLSTPLFPSVIAWVESPDSRPSVDVGYASDTTVNPPPRFFVAQFPAKKPPSQLILDLGLCLSRACLGKLIVFTLRMARMRHVSLRTSDGVGIINHVVAPALMSVEKGAAHNRSHLTVGWVGRVGVVKHHLPYIKHTRLLLRCHMLKITRQTICQDSLETKYIHTVRKV